jgi:2-dehydro-3-deoxy-D-arabinonate dehydratase
MQIVKFTKIGSDGPWVGLLSEEGVVPIAQGPRALSDLLHAADPEGNARAAIQKATVLIPFDGVKLLAPIDAQEVWGAGVTYERSKVAREEESEQAATFYDKVYRAARPELFFKATPSRVVGPGVPIRVRRDTRWCVPEPELALVLSPDLRIVGFTIGNDVSARDIEGENPLYLPQAKMYDACCGLGPAVALASAVPDPRGLTIGLKIERGATTAFEGLTSVSRMARRFEDLVDWLGIDNQFPDGVVLLTGTGIVPPDDFTLQAGDVVSITVDGIGTLTNPVVQSAAR